jgi:hypothetical protein
MQAAAEQAAAAAQQATAQVTAAAQQAAAAAQQAAAAAEQAAAEQLECCVCLSQPKNVAFTPCGHACTCIECGEAIFNSTDDPACPLCRALVTGFTQVFFN